MMKRDSIRQLEEKEKSYFMMRRNLGVRRTSLDGWMCVRLPSPSKDVPLAAESLLITEISEVGYQAIPYPRYLQG
jgi:hypothetical protein